MVFIALTLCLCYVKKIKTFDKLFENSEIIIANVFYEPYEHNSYIVINKKVKECIIIDPGNQINEVIEYVREKGVKVNSVFLTHNHLDHSCGIRQLQKEFSVPVLIHKNQLEMAKTELGIDFEALNYKLVNEDTIIELGEIEFNILFTPGHSPGGICLYTNRKLIFTGDTLFKGSIGRTDLVGSSSEEIDKSLDKIIKEIGKDFIIFPGHGSKTTVLNELNNNPFLSKL